MEYMDLAAYERPNVGMMAAATIRMSRHGSSRR